MVRDRAGAVPGDVPVEQRPVVHNLWFWLWDVYIVLMCTAALLSAVLDPFVPAVRRYGAAGALVCAVLWYVVFGRRTILSGDEGWRAFAFVAGALVLLGANTAFMPNVQVMLFAVYPMIFMTLPLRFSIPLVALASVISATGLVVTDRSQQLLIPGIGLLVSTIMGSFTDLTARESARRAELIEELEASQAEVARLSHEAGTAAERSRLAREIHDTLAQGFTSIVTLVQAAESELDGDRQKARRHLALAASTARENLAEARSMVAALTPAALDGSLESALRRQVERFAEETEIAAVYRIVGTAAGLPTPVEVVLLRAAQEALSNVRRHSGASSVTVVLRFGADSVGLSVFDDGSGFTGAPGFGLRGMRERAEQVSGTLAVHSVPGSGTRVELEVPR
jgi:signal transduction histidine kinase